MRALRVTIEDPGTRRVEQHVFFRSPVRIGRTHLNDLHLESAYVSQYHSIISFDDDGIEYLDLGSTNGSVIDGTAATAFASIPLTEESTVSVGELRLTLERSDERPPAPLEMPGEKTINESGDSATTVDSGTITHVRQAQTALDAVRPAYQAFREAARTFRDRLKAALLAAPLPVRVLALSALRENFPDLGLEPDLRALAKEVGASESSLAGAAGADGSGLLALAKLLGFGEGEFRAERDGARLMHNVAEVLDAFATGFVELRRGLEQFGSEVAVKAFSRQTGLHTAHTGQDVLAYLMARHERGQNRIGELKGAFADIMIHQVALITGIMEGVRSLLKRLDPETIAGDVANDPERVGGMSIRRGIWPWSVTALWRRFQRLHSELVEDDRGVSSVLFGREFARSYGAAKVRHRSAAEEKPAAMRRRSTAIGGGRSTPSEARHRGGKGG